MWKFSRKKQQQEQQNQTTKSASVTWHLNESSWTSSCSYIVKSETQKLEAKPKQKQKILCTKWLMRLNVLCNGKFAFIMNFFLSFCFALNGIRVNILWVKFWLSNCPVCMCVAKNELLNSIQMNFFSHFGVFFFSCSSDENYTKEFMFRQQNRLSIGWRHSALAIVRFNNNLIWNAYTTNIQFLYV